MTDTDVRSSNPPFSNHEVAPTHLPSFTAITFTHARADYPRLVLSIVLIVYLVLAAVATVVTVLFVSEVVYILTSPFGIVAAPLSLLLLVFIAWHTYTWSKIVSYAIREHDIVLRSGVFWRKEVIQPLKRVQHVEVSQGPIEKRYTLSKVKLFSAGTINSTFVIPGLDYSEGARIREYVLDYQNKMAANKNE